MFVCIKKTDINLLNVEVFVNGEKVNRCFCADEELGIALCYKQDDQGHLVRNSKNLNQLEKILYQGKVEIIKLKRGDKENGC
jgi:hypothetical protein